jgi:hypothetical protein
MISIRRGARATLTSALFALIAVAGLMWGNGVSRAAVTNIDTGLSGVWENPPVTSPGFAIAHFTFDDSTRVLTYAVTVSGLSPDQVTMAHIHRGAIGVNGPIIYTLSDKGFTQVSGQITLTDADVADLRAGNLYVNVHSTAFPNGFARGQLFLNPADNLTASAKAAVDAYNASNMARLQAFFTNKGFVDEFNGTTKAEATAHPDEIFQGPVSFRGVTNAVITGTNATANFEIGVGDPSAPVQVVQREFHTWVLDAGLWKVSSSRPDTSLPAGVTPVNVSLKEFSFTYNAAAAAAGPTAFHFTNDGTQEHEAVFVQITDNKPLTDIIGVLAAGGPDAPPPPDVNFINANEAPPGSSFDFVLSNRLPAGRYAFICFFTDAATGQPHALLGMRSEFTVGAGGGTGILPPNTGSAGLKAAAANQPVPYFALAALTLVLGLAVAVPIGVLRRR